MRALDTSKLKAGLVVPAALLHQSGTQILAPGEELTAEILAVILEVGCDKLFLLDKTEDPAEVRRKLLMMPVATGDLQPGQKISRSLYDPKGALLLEAGSAIPKSFAATLAQRGMSTIFYKKPEEQIKGRIGRTIQEKVELLQGKRVAPAPQSIEEEPLPSPAGPVARIVVEKKIDTAALARVNLTLAKPEEMTEAHLSSAIDSATTLKIAPSGEPLDAQLRNQRMVMQTEEEKNTFVDIYQTCIDCTREIFERLNSDGRIDGNAVRQVIEQAVAALIRNRELLMAAGQINLPDNYLVSHSVAVAALSINIGCSMGFSMSQILSLGMGGLLADVGMIKIPSEVRNHEGQLATREWQEIQRHPTYGLDMLQSIIGIPAEIPFIVYQSHERSDGSGYPKGKKDIIIHTFAKIVATADIYHSIISARPHRTAMTPYEAMEQLVLMCGKKQLDPMVVRSFLKCNSMFPVGSWVEVNEKVKARVVAANPVDFMRPVVTPVFDVSGNKLNVFKRIDLLENKNLTVTKALDDDQVKATGTMEGF